MLKEKEKIAILVDSGMDVPKEYQERYHIYSIPLIVSYSDGEYQDGIDITPQEVYDRLKDEIPKTSLPSVNSIKEKFEEICQDGFEKVIAITISSGLSGTNNVINMVAKELNQLTIEVVDTKNIGIGAGFTGILAGQLLEKGYGFDEAVKTLRENTEHTKIFFCLETLEYLRKGGRIGLVAGAVGDIFKIKPIISCNEEGIYYTVSKARGRKQSLRKTMELAENYAGTFKKCNIAVANGNAPEDAKYIADILKKKFPDSNIFLEGQISPALVVHTGPGLIGIAIQRNILE